MKSIDTITHNTEMAQEPPLTWEYAQQGKTQIFPISR